MVLEGLSLLITVAGVWQPTPRDVGKQQQETKQILLKAEGE